MKYLFSAQFNDGAAFQQDEEDKHPSKPDKSSFTHLLEEADLHGGIVLFQLNGERHNYIVDLRDGHFEIDGIHFEVHSRPMEELPEELPALRLIYYRTVKQCRCGEEEWTEMAFNFGWQTTLEGKNVQQVIMIK